MPQLLESFPAFLEPRIDMSSCRLKNEGKDVSFLKVNPFSGITIRSLPRELGLTRKLTSRKEKIALGHSYKDYIKENAQVLSFYFLDSSFLSLISEYSAGTYKERRTIRHCTTEIIDRKKSLFLVHQSSWAYTSSL